MGIDFKKPETTKTVNTKSEQPMETPMEMPEPKFDMVAEQTELRNRFEGSPEVDKLASQIDVYDLNTIVRFGSEAATEISKCSDQVLNSMNLKQINDTGTLLEELGKIMDQFDIDEIRDEGEKKSFLNRFRKKLQQKIDEILTKYDTMGKHIDKIYIQLKQYEVEIGEANKKLDTMFHANLGFYQDLQKYILAGEQGIKEISDYADQKRAEYANNPADTMLQFEIQELEQAQLALEQRTHDLKIAENVAMQSIPMLRNMEFSNMNLIRKINSAFIITLPVFKQALAQAILLKRQKIQAEAMSALDERTNKMLIKNASNTVTQSKMIAQMASGSSIQIETLEKTWQTITDGIRETKQIEQDARIKRMEDAKRLEVLNADFMNQMSRNITK